MGQVIEQYIKAMIAVLIVFVVLFLFYELRIGDRKGVSQLMGYMVQTEMLEVSKPYENRAFQDWHNVYTPKIQYKNPYVLQGGQEVLLADCVEGIDEDGTQTLVKLHTVWDEMAREVEVNMTEEGMLCLEKPGIYWMSLSTEDTRGYARTVFVKLVVNGGQNT